MANNRERSGKIRAVVSRLLAALVLVALFSWPGSAAIKRFTDEKGTLHITNEGTESTPQASTFPVGRSSRIRGSGAFPGPATDPQPPPQPAPPPPEPAPAPEEPEDTGQEEEPEEPPPAHRGRR